MRLLFPFFIFLAYTSIAQTRDSVYYQLPTVEVSTVSKESSMRLLSSEGMISRQDLNKQPSYSMLPALNSIPGVRMEERSPGSYRLSIRGSLLRSPFGVRDVKIYLGDFPFTDAGGNTYLNSLDIGNINSLRILKGPEASIFGANIGGVLIIDPVQKTPDSLKITSSLSTGSYGLLHENVMVQKRWKKFLLNVNQGYQKSNGYRENSAMHRLYIQAAGVWNYNSKAFLKTLLLYSDMNYQTPGGLTLQQYNDNPQQARLATATLPSASTQKAGIYNKTFFAGISHDVNISKNLRHVISIFGSHTNFQNPFITNFEQRTEYTYGARTYLDLSLGKKENISGKWNIGAEWQQTNSSIYNYGNNKGNKDTIQAADQINANQSFVFTRFLIDIRQRLLIEASLSYNFFSYQYRNIYPLGESTLNNRNFNPQLMPRIALSYIITPNFSWRASASTGYSTPTIAEVRPSDNLVNTSLQAERGQNYETGFRLRDNKDYFWFDASAFYYFLQNAIVQRINVDGTEYFINAGGTRQPGIEAQASLWVIKPGKLKFIRSLQLKGNITYNHFTFSNYTVNNADYSNNKLTGVPDYTTVESISLEFPANFSLYSQYYYSAGIPLNDGNTAFAKSYHLVQLKAQWNTKIGKMNWSIFAGIDNLLNQKYSLGNDLNAIGGRYYNAAPPRNYYVGIKTEF